MYFLMKLLSMIACLCPRKLRCLIGNGIGSFTWLLVPQRRKKLAVENIILSLKVDEQEAKQIAARSWKRFGRMIMEVLSFPVIQQDIKKIVKIEGQEYMDEALSFGKGVVLATGHIGNWELIGAALALNPYPLVAVAQKQSNAGMDQFINEYRSSLGMHVTYKAGVREMLRFLGQGYIIGLLVDQDADSDGVILDFFGRKASCPQGAAFLGRMKNAPIVPAFITENQDGTHTLLIKKCVWVERTDDKDADLKATTAQLTKLIESHIRDYPTEWFWLHDRWKYTRRNNLI